MSPEQIIGRNVDARSDVWSAGVTLFETLTGVCPFVADNLPSLRIKIVNGNLPELLPELAYAHELKAVLEKALAKDREARYQTAAEFGMELRSLMLKIQQADLSSPAVEPPPSIHDAAFSWNLNDSSEQRLPPPKPFVNLGFREQLRAGVFLIYPERRLWFDAYNINSFYALGGLVGAAGLLLLIIGLGAVRWLNLFWPLSPALIFTLLGALWALVILGAATQLLYECIVPPQALRCRSCQRKMRTASDWRRSVWLVDREGLCVADCLTALKEDHWEDSVTLFLLHTTAERMDTRYRLMFLECRSCQDQRAYFWFSPPPVNYPVSWDKTPRWTEAYKFHDSRKAEEFAKTEKLRKGASPAISNKNTADVHDQMTI